MTNDEIKTLALSLGFKERPQENGEMDLNPYVYEFAHALIRKSILISSNSVANHLRAMADELVQEAEEFQNIGDDDENAD